MRRSKAIRLLSTVAIGSALILGSVGCGSSSQPTATAVQPAATATVAPTAVATGTPMPIATATEAAVATPSPTSPTTATPALSQGEERYYAARVGDRTMGYTTFKVTGASNDKVTTESHTLLKFTSGGAAQTMDYRAKTELTSDLKPLHYALDFDVQGSQGTIDTTVANGSATMKATVGGKDQNLSVPVAPGTFLIDNNLFDQYSYVFAALKLEPDLSTKVSVLVPQAGQTLTVDLHVGPLPEDIKVGDKTYDCLVVSVEQPQAMKFWVTKDGLLVRLAIPSQNFVLELADDSVIGRVTSVDIFATLANAMADSNVQFSGYWAVEHMTAEIDIKSSMAPVDQSFLSYRGQQFEGTVDGNHIVGTVKTADTRTFNSLPPAGTETAETLRKYLQPAARIESDDPAIIAKAKELTQGTKDQWEAAQAIGDWVYKNISYQITGKGAKDTLASGVGDCGPHTFLSVALLRASGIPARLVGGVMYSEGKFGQHYWTEVYTEKSGWIPMDTTAGELGYLDATHIRLWELDGVGSIKIKVTDYSESMTTAAPSESKQTLQLASGDEALYRILVGDKELGTSGYKVASVEKRGSVDVYHLATTLTLDPTKLGGQGQPVQMTGELQVDAQAAPLSYVAKASTGGDEQTIDAQFADGKVHEKVVAGGQTIEKDVTLPAGAYLLGSNQIAMFDLMYRTLPLKEGMETTVSAYFSENFTTLDVHMKVGEKRETIQVGNKSYDCFVVEIGQFGPEMDYVTTDGRLMRVSVPSRKVVADLVQ